MDTNRARPAPTYRSLAGPPGREHVGADDAAAHLGVKVSWLRKAVLRPGGPPSALLGGERRFPISGLEDWLDEQWHGTPGSAS